MTVKTPFHNSNSWCNSRQNQARCVAGNTVCMVRLRREGYTYQKVFLEQITISMPFGLGKRQKEVFTLHILLEQVQAVLTTTPERWQRLVSTLPIDLLTRPPATGEWSALNCLQHLLEAEHVLFPVRLHAFLAGQDFNDFDPHQQHADPEAQTPEQLAAAFARYRQESLVLLKQVKDDDLARTAQHPKLGTVTLAEMLHTWAAHDLMHTVQAERALMQPFMLGCGPWRPFFRDHESGVAKE
ncbi:MAG: DinB family protein [Chloroflexi bacterium]|nr:MAG: DinB family protein [Chloroflexota bacterium]